MLEALGGPDERIRTTTAQAFDLKDINPLNVLAVEVESSREARVLPLTPGRADDLFEHDGQITKREVRAVTLSALAPRRGELLWDIGAGSGSISIEWMLADPSMRAIAIEADAERAARIRRNASAFGVPGLTVVEGAAPAALAGLPTPDAIFIGGGGTDAGVHGRGDRRAACRRPAGRQRGDAGDGGAAAGQACRARRRAGPHRHFARNGGRLDERLAAGHAGHAMVLGQPG